MRTHFKTFLTMCASLALFGCAGQGTPGKVQDEISRMLDSSAEAWNREDFEGFVNDYAAEPTTTFMSGGKPQHGIEWIRNNYAATFEPGAQHDSLRFEDIETRPLGKSYALATARYVLFRDDSTTSSGPFTLVLRRTESGWKIIHDHTSSD